MLGISFLCRVLSIRGLNRTSSPGIRVNTDSRLSIIALMSTMAISMPMVNFIKARAARPLTVVRDEALISGMALLRASTAASRAFLVSCSSENRWHRMMA